MLSFAASLGIPSYPTGKLTSLVIWVVASKCYRSQRTLGSKRDPYKRRAPPPDHACHSSYSQYFVSWTGIPANKMASCDCLQGPLCDYFAHKKTLHAHVKCCISIRGKFWRLVVFVYVITGNRNSHFFSKHGFRSNFVLKIYYWAAGRPLWNKNYNSIPLFLHPRRQRGR